jgi:hypothetical protein
MWETLLEPQTRRYVCSCNTWYCIFAKHEVTKVCKISSLVPTCNPLTTCEVVGVFLSVGCWVHKLEARYTCTHLTKITPTSKWKLANQWINWKILETTHKLCIWIYIEIWYFHQPHPLEIPKSHAWLQRYLGI